MLLRIHIAKVEEPGISKLVKTCGKAENDEAKSGNDEAKGVPGRRGVTEGDGR